LDDLNQTGIFDRGFHVSLSEHATRIILLAVCKFTLGGYFFSFAAEPRGSLTFAISLPVCICKDVLENVPG